MGVKKRRNSFLTTHESRSFVFHGFLLPVALCGNFAVNAFRFFSPPTFHILSVLTVVLVSTVFRIPTSEFRINMYLVFMSCSAVKSLFLLLYVVFPCSSFYTSPTSLLFLLLSYLAICSISTPTLLFFLYFSYLVCPYLASLITLLIL